MLSSALWYQRAAANVKDPAALRQSGPRRARATRRSLVGLRARQPDRERDAHVGRVERDLALLVLDEPPHHREAEARALRLGREEGLEDAEGDVGRERIAVVHHLQVHAVVRVL